MKKYVILGNLLIISGILGLVYTFYPLISSYSGLPKKAISANKNGIYIRIPKISAYAEIILNVDPINASIYNEALKRGVAHARGTALPGEGGMSFLFAHSSAPPWENTRYNSVFLRLNELTNRDIIVITNKDKETKYIVYDKKEVWPDEVRYLNNGDKDKKIILQTCTPIGTSLRRLLIFARPAS